MTEARKTALKLRDDNKFFSEKLLKVETKDGQLVSFKYNSPQEKIQAVVDKLEAEGKPVRIIILKARQMGISTWVQSQIYRRCSTKGNMSGGVIAHRDDAATGLFRISQRFHNNTPEELRFKDGSIFAPQPVLKYSNRKELVFRDLESQIRVMTAGSEEAGRSETFQALHCSEVAFWKNARSSMLALLQGLGDFPNTFAVIESTANGVGGYFYDLWQRAKQGETSWVPIFLAWWELEEYQMPLSKAEKKHFILSQEEKEGQERYGWSLEQIKWRRFTIADKCDGDVDKFRQEYPANEQEAFLVSGRPYFDIKKLLKSEVGAGVRGNLVLEEGTYRQNEDGYIRVNRNTKVRFEEHPHGFVELWGYPREFGAYCVGADVALGLKDGDYSSAQVLDRDSGQQIAEWHGHIDPDLFAEELIKLALYFNWAWLGIEINNHGLTTMTAAVKTAYPRLYQRRTGMDKSDLTETDRLGWQTTAMTRPIMLDTLSKSIRDDSLIISGDGLLNECFTFVISPRGKPQAQEGCFDDRVMAMAIALQVHSHCPMTRPVSEFERRRRQRERDRKLRPVVSNVTGY